MAKQVVEPVRNSIVGRYNLIAPHRLLINRFTDQRKADRLPLACPVTYLIEAFDKRLEGRTTTVDLSSIGVKLTIPDMVSPQTPCQLAITLPEHQEPLLFRGRVAWCRLGRRKPSKTYETGIAFIRPSSYTDPTFALLCRFIATQLLKRHLSR